MPTTRTKPKSGVGRPRKCGAIPLSEYEGILACPPADKPFLYTCPHPIVLSDWLQILGVRGLKMPEVHLIATPTSLHFMATSGTKQAIIDINVAGSYQFTCDRIYRISLNLPLFTQIIKKIVGNSTSVVQLYTIKDRMEELFLESKEIGDGPFHTNSICVNSFEILSEPPIITYQPDGNPDGATFRDFPPDTFKKLFKSKQYSDGSPFCDLTITGSEVAIFKQAAIGGSPKTIWRDRRDIEIPEGCVIKSLLIPYRDVGEFCSKDIKNMATIMVGETDCRMVKRIFAGECVELLFYYCVQQQNVV